MFFFVFQCVFFALFVKINVLSFLFHLIINLCETKMSQIRRRILCITCILKVMRIFFIYYAYNLVDNPILFYQYMWLKKTFFKTDPK